MATLAVDADPAGADSLDPGLGQALRECARQPVRRFAGLRSCN